MFFVIVAGTQETGRSVKFCVRWRCNAERSVFVYRQTINNKMVISQILRIPRLDNNVNLL